MSRTAYVNGQYVPHSNASVHIEDRGYQFADGVYEVIAVMGGELIDEQPHLARLDRSLAELSMAPAVDDGALRFILREVVRRNRVRNGIVYVQITRGVAPRDHGFPEYCPSSIVVTARSQTPKSQIRKDGVLVITAPDIRWKRCDIKSVSLLPNILAKQMAVEAGAYEAWLIDENGNVTEGTATNAWIVTDDGYLVTRPTNEAILDGITRQSIVKLAKSEGFELQERAFSLEEAKKAAETFLTSTTSWVTPIITIDETRIGDGTPGPLTRSLQAHYQAYIGDL